MILAPLYVTAQEEDVFDSLLAAQPEGQVIQQAVTRPKTTVKCNGTFYIYLNKRNAPIKAIFKNGRVMSVFQISGFTSFNLVSRNSLSFEFTSNGVTYARLNSASYVQTVKGAGNVNIDLYNGITEEVIKNHNGERVVKRSSTLCEVYPYNGK